MIIPYFQDESVIFYLGDSLAVLPSLAENSMDACVTDPPYELGFMGKAWDNSGIAYNVDLWREVYRVLKPGAYLLAFGGSRTYHRMACAIEDAGFEIRDQIQWIYGSGFPKSLDVSKAIDKVGGRPDLIVEIGKALKSAREARGMTASECDRIFCGGTTNWSWFEGRPRGQRCPTPDTFNAITTLWPELKHLADAVAEVEREIIGAKGGYLLAFAPGQINDRSQTELSITTGTSLNAKTWDGWGTALKPAHEPICMARKPLEKGLTVAQNVLKWGTGAINVDKCRIGTEEIVSLKGLGLNKNLNDDNWKGIGSRPEPTTSIGRFPANVIHDGSDEVLARFPETTSGGGNKANIQPKARESQVLSTIDGGDWDANTGSASRFFYCAKASKSDRNGGLDGFPVDRPDSRTAIGMGTFEEKGVQPQQNHHPTVKPTDLMQYLCRLVTPPGGLILEPFLGSGSTAKAATSALIDGFKVVGIELNEDYMQIAQARFNGTPMRLF